jgi:ATP-dependent Zn protease
MHLAHFMVWVLGMGSSGLVGDYTIYKDANALFLSEDVKLRLNQDVDKILKECMVEVEALLRKEKDLFERFSHELLQKNELDYDEIEAIFNEFGKANPRKFGSYTPGNEPPKV